MSKKGKEVKFREWAINMSTDVMLYRAWSNDGAYIYQVKGIVYTDIREAVVESCAFGNARREGVFLRIHDKDDILWGVYDANGGHLLITNDSRSAALRLAHYTNTKPPVSDEVFQKRKNHYLARRRAQIERGRRVMIEQEKARILEERRLQREKEEVERRYALELKKLGDVAGSW